MSTIVQGEAVSMALYVWFRCSFRWGQCPEREGWRHVCEREDHSAGGHVCLRCGARDPPWPRRGEVPR